MDVSIGTSGQPFEMSVEAGKIREFARATRSRNAAYISEQATSPPTFLMAMAFWSGPENAAWGDARPNLARVLHGEQEFIFHGPPPRAGTRLRAVARVDRVFDKQGKRGGSMQFVETVTEFREIGTGELVATCRGTLIETSRSTAAE